MDAEQKIKLLEQANDDLRAENRTLRKRLETQSPEYEASILRQMKETYTALCENVKIEEKKYKALMAEFYELNGRYKKEINRIKERR